jgi:hypothetical protein
MSSRFRIVRTVVVVVFVIAMLAGCGVVSTAGGTRSHGTHRRVVGQPSHPLLPPSVKIVLSSTVLESVSCSVSGYCLVEAESGRFWSLSGMSKVVELGQSPLVRVKNAGIGSASVSCFSGDRCMVILFSRDVVELVNGKWQRPVELSLGHVLTGLGCAVDGFCAAIDGLGDAYLLSGEGWSTAVNAWGSALFINCQSSQSCFAVGGGVSHWNGEKWTKPVAIDPGATMVAIACIDSMSCVVVDNKGRYLRWKTDHWTSPIDVTSSSLAAVASLNNEDYVVINDAGVFYSLRAGKVVKVGSLKNLDGLVSGMACTTATPGDIICYVTSTRGSVYVQRIPQSSLAR